jgi:LysM repeat protein
MMTWVRSRAGAVAVLLSAVIIGVAACSNVGTGSTGGATTSIPASTSFRTIPVTSTTSTTVAPAASGDPAASEATGGAGGDTYTIRAGDAWALIARRVGVSLDRLLTWNGATAKTPLYTGRTVRIPPAESAATADPATATPDATAPAGFVLHTVVVGDTWIGIAKKYGVDWKAVMSANGVTPDVNSKAPLTVGGQIKVPKKA